MFTKGILANIHPFHQLVLLLIISLLSLLIATTLASLFLFLYTGIGLADTFTIMQQLDDPLSILYLRVLQIANQIGLFIIPPLLFAGIVAGKPGAFLRITVSTDTLMIILSLLVLVSAYPFVYWLMLINKELALPEWLHRFETWMHESEASAEQLTKLFLEVQTTREYLFNLFMIAVLPAIGEELFFRGALQTLLHRWTKNGHAAVWISAVLFSALHLQFFGFLPRLFLGVLFGYMVMFGGSLWLAIAAHFFNNATAVTIAWFYRRGWVSADYDQINYLAGSGWMFAGLIITGLLLFVIYSRSKGKQYIDY
ncbi:MAG TPA: CPBP family intramembrane glutamic endopeptidase [Bacteroidales bacterium]|nr:CPBP family intramembrane glutamic endopeptidase [Bacteroidales bacterium]